MTCPRCRSSDTELMTRAPVADAWEVHLCPTCFYTWRSSEPESATDPELYDERFRLTPDEIARFAEFPPVPALPRKNRT